MRGYLIALCFLVVTLFAFPAQEAQAGPLIRSARGTARITGKVLKRAGWRVLHPFGGRLRGGCSCSGCGC